MKENYTIPVFIPHQGCPHQCIFCNQKRITGSKTISPQEVSEVIERYLTTIPLTGVSIEIGFFGGSFTGLPLGVQEEYLRVAQPFLKESRMRGIRLSTRPDYINNEVLALLKKYRVTCVELGIQSMCDTVLGISRRGHTRTDSIRASKLIVDEGFILGHQIMIGLPGSSFDKELETAQMAKNLGAGQVRLYPVIVIKDTDLADMWQRNEYLPLAEDEAIERCAEIIQYFESNKIKVIRCGLHPSEGLLAGSEYLAGPFHPAFGLKVRSRIFAELLRQAINQGVMRIIYHSSDQAALYGYQGSNRSLLESITLQHDNKIPRGCLQEMGGV